MKNIDLPLEIFKKKKKKHECIEIKHEGNVERKKVSERKRKGRDREEESECSSTEAQSCEFPGKTA